MSKHKATASKHAHSPKIAASAQRAAQAVVRSPKDSRQPLVGPDSTESPPQRHEGPVVETPATVLQDDRTPTMAANAPRKALELSSVTANVRAYQAKLLEMAQANMQLAFEFAQRLAAVRSPVEFLSVNAEFTGKRMALFRQHSKEMIELIAKR
jgi:hypothetical protein